jgi:DNA-binding NarL/FixJ family response regulator
MDSRESEKNINLHSRTTTHINIVGKNKLENELLVLFLEKEMGVPCKHFSYLKATASTNNNDSECTQCLLVDCNGIDIKNLWSEIASWKKSEEKKCLFALYNVDPEMKIEKSALANSVKGIFYKNDAPKIIPKGLFAILNGDLWYSRKTLKKCILEKGRSKNREEYGCADDILSSREKQVLSLIASGYKSKAVADCLSISPHTVKAHIYNIYEKINVNNRLQATLWSVRYLRDVDLVIRKNMTSSTRPSFLCNIGVNLTKTDITSG